MTTVLERVSETRLLESIPEGLPECSFEGLFTGPKSNRRLMTPEKCHREATWIARYPKCGHAEPWCSEHAARYQKARLLIICFCREETPSEKVIWREL